MNKYAKIPILIIILLMTSMSFGQTNGTGTDCSNAILLDHSQNPSTYTGSGETEIWFTFVADTSYMKFWLQDFPNSKIKLYSGTCSDLQVLDSNTVSLINNSLALGSTYYIQVENSNSNTYLYSLLSSDVECNLECGIAPNCNKITNGNFSQNDGSYGASWNYTPQGLTYFWEAFSEGSASSGYFSHVTAWHSLWGTSDIINDGSVGMVLGFRAGKSASSNSPGGVIPERYVSESVVTCTDLQQDEIYILNYECRINDNANNYGLDLHWRITNDGIDDEMDPSISSYEDILDLPHDIENISFEEISVEPVDYLTYQPHSIMFKPNADYNRMYLFPQAWNISQMGSHWGLINNVSITPIIYDDVTTCNADEFTLGPTCLDAIENLDIYSDLTFLWTSSQAGAIAAGTETLLTPTIDPTVGNPFIFLTCTITNTLTGEEFTTDVQVTYSPLQANVESTGDCTNGTGNPCSGSITVTGATGTAPFTYEITNTLTPPFVTQSNSTGVFTGLCIDDYTLIVTDANGCTYTKIIPIKATELTVDAGFIHTYPSQSCGLVNVNVTNGTGTAPYTYEWTDDATPIPNIIGNDYEVALLPEGTYYVTVIDANGCSAVADVHLMSASINLYQDVDEYVCDNGMANLDVPNVYDSYLWNTGANTDFLNVQNLGDYTCDMYTDAGCRLQKTFHVKPYPFDIDVDAEHCPYWATNMNPVQYTLTATAGYSNYAWTITYFRENGEETVFYNSGSIITAYGIVTQPWEDNNWSHCTVHLTADSPDGCQLVKDITIEFIDDLFPGGIYTYYSSEFPDQFGVWDDVHWFFYSDVTVPIGQQLTIKNSTIEFAPGYGINVDGANTKLIIDNSTITNVFCEDMLWQGISLKGNPYKPHTEEYQPLVKVINESVIKNSEIGIHSIDGGIIQAFHSKFVNNNCAIQFNEYHYTNLTYQSNIYNNEFITNHEGRLINDFNFTSFVNLIFFPRMRLYWNTFRNTDYESDIYNRGTAIKSTKVAYLSIFGNTFEHLTTAVDVNNSLSLQLGSNSGNNNWENSFKNNYKGAFLNRIKALQARYNTFDDALLMPTTNAFQMMVAGCYLPNIAHNSFNNGVVGLSLYKGNIYEDETYQIYKNSFTNFKLYSNANLNGYPTAILTNGDHGSIANDAGAEIKCNTFKDYDYAIAVMGGEIKMAQGAYSQTNNQAPAGNRFFDDNNMPDGRFFVNAGLNGGYKYYHHALAPVTKLENYRTISAVADLNGSSGLFVYDNACPDQSPLMSLSIAEIKELIDELRAEIASKKDELSAKVDNGNTDLLLSDIQIANQYNYYGLVFKLFQTQGYLSDASAVAFMQKDVNRDMAKAIAIIANSPLPEAAKSEIDNLDMNSYLKDYIWYLQNGENVREQDEKEIHALELRKNSLLRIIEQKAYKDTTGEKYSEAVDVFLEQDEWKQKEKAYHMLKNSPRKDEAPSVFLQLQEDLINFEQQKRYHMEDYLQLLEFGNQIDTLSDSLRVVNITTQEDLLQTIKTSEFTEGKMAAESLLEEAGLDPIEPLFIQLPNPNADRSATQQDETPKAKNFNFASTPDLIEVYPNPVDDILTVEYLMFNGMSANTIGIYDINGKLLITQKISKAMDILDINVSQLSAGTYIIAFGKDGTSSNSTKFIVK